MPAHVPARGYPPQGSNSYPASARTWTAVNMALCLPDLESAREGSHHDPDIEYGGGQMAVQWSKDVDQSLLAAKEQGRPLLLDFSAAPA